jgi:outer membrane protein assembly factor BamB
MHYLHLGTLFALTFSASARAADWPQWLGPNRDGVTTEKIAPWKGDLKPAWTKEVGEGNSSPVVSGGLVFLHTKVKDMDEERVQAFDAKSGEVKWEQKYAKAKFKPFFGEGPRSTPCVVGDRLYTFGNTGVLTCWNSENGFLIWQVDTLKDFKENNLFFGVSMSPIVTDDKVLVMTGKGKTGVVAFQRSSGKVAWKVEGDPASYSSPLAFGKGADRQIVFLTGANVLSVSPKGDVLWKYPFVDKLNESSTTPVKVGDMLIASSVSVGAIGLKMTEKDGKRAAEKIWANDKLTCYFSTPVPVGKDYVYMVTGVASLTSASITLRCVDVATGKELWNKPNMGKFHAAIVKLGNDDLFMLTDAGELVLLAPDVKEYKELARAKVCGETWAHPAIANGHVYVRDGKELLCYKMSE